MSEELLQSALLQEAERVGIVDPDILAAYPEELKTAKLGADGKPDVGSSRRLFGKSKAEFRRYSSTQDSQEMDSAQYAEAEKKFREKLSRHARPEARSEYKSLDAALLTDEESGALRRHLSGTRSTATTKDQFRRRDEPDTARRMRHDGTKKTDACRWCDIYRSRLFSPYAR